jgi:hypothetical protein
MTFEESPRELLKKATTDEVSRAVREDVCRKLAATFRTVGELLWAAGYLFGTDRRDGQSPFGFGSDATVGLALVVEIGGELLTGTVALLEHENVYGAAALLRQIVEVEYLTWAFAEDQQEAMIWLRATPDERRKLWQPIHLRNRSGGRFRASDYHGHCERGGHPTPDATMLLPGHSRKVPIELWWLDLAEHGVSAWSYVDNAADSLGYAKEVRSAADKHGLPNAIARWQRDDRLRSVALGTVNLFSVPNAET